MLVGLSELPAVLFCSCPNEATSAQTAMRPRKLGITRIRPLAGWRKGLPLQALKVKENAVDALGSLKTGDARVPD